MPKRKRGVYIDQHWFKSEAEAVEDAKKHFCYFVYTFDFDGDGRVPNGRWYFSGRFPPRWVLDEGIDLHDGRVTLGKLGYWPTDAKLTDARYRRKS